MSSGLNIPKKPKTFSVALAIGSLLILLVACIASIPTFLSTELGKRLLFAYIRSHYDTTVQCNQLALTWFGQIQITHIALTDDLHQAYFTCDMIKTEVGLWDVLFKHNLGHLYLDRPQLTMHPSTLSSLHTNTLQNKQALLGIPAIHAPVVHLSVPYTGTLNCSLGRLEIAPAGVDPIFFDEIALDMEINPEQSALQVHVLSKTRQKEMQGTIQADATLTALNTASSSIKTEVHIADLPVDGIDQLIGLFFPHFRGMLVQLVGNTADVELNAAASSLGMDVNCVLNSPQFNCDFVVATENGQIMLKKPGQFSLRITPDSFCALSALNPRLHGLLLQQESTLEAVVTAFTSPLLHAVPDVLQASFSASMRAVSPLEFVFQGTSFVLDIFEISSKNAEVAGAILVSANASLVTPEEPAALSVEGIYTSSEGTYSFLGTALPTRIIGQLGNIPSLDTFIGEVVTVKGSGNMGKENRMHFSLQSPLLTVQKAEGIITDRFTLQSPIDFSYLITPDTMRYLLPKNSITLAEQAMLIGKINTLSLPWTALEDLHMDIALAAESIHFIPFTISSVQAILAIDSLDAIDMRFTSERYRAHAAGRYNKTEDKLTFTAPILLDAICDNDLLSVLLPTPLCLIEPIVLKVLIDPFIIPVRSFAMQKFACIGRAAAPTISLLPFEGSPPIVLTNAVLPFQWNGPNKTAAASLSASLQKDAGSLAVTTSFSHLQWDNLQSATAAFLIEVQKFPSTLIDAWIKQPLCAPLLGNHFSTTVKIDSSPEIQNIHLTLLTPLLNIKSAFTLDSHSATLTSPAQVKWSLTSEGYGVLDRLLSQQATNLFELSEATVFQLNIAKCTLPVSQAGRIPHLRFDTAALQCIGDISNPLISLFDKSAHESMRISELRCSLNKTVNNPLAFSCNSKIVSESTLPRAESGKNGSVSIDGTTHTDGATRIAMQIKQFPSRVLDLFARFKGKTDFPFTKIFGNTINASLQTNLVKWTGPVSVNLSSPFVHLSLNGSLQNKILQLTQPIYAQMKITPETSRLFLQEANPLSLSYFYSEAPITVEIPAAGFSLPLHPVHLESITIPSAHIELGKIACRNEGNINLALGLLKAQQWNKTQELLLWFAPIDLHVNQGIVDMERTEILLNDTFDIAIWGKVLLVKSYVDMILGLPAETLIKAFGVQGLPDDYVLTIPMKGPTDNVKIDTGKASRKIALLLATQQKALTDALGKNPAGAFFGGVLQQMVRLPDNDNVPPAKHPFPWEKQKTSRRKSQDKPLSKKRHFDPKEKPLKQLLKVLH